jgi:hypothetical protein
MSIKSLEMLKMEKNLAAVIEKGYNRQPYEAYPITLNGQTVDYLQEHTLIGFVGREFSELINAIEMLHGAIAPNVELTENVRNEIADVSNCLDYLYEAVLRKEIEWMQK